VISLDRIVAWQYSAMRYWASDMIASVEGKQSQSVMRTRIIKLCCSVVRTLCSHSSPAGSAGCGEVDAGKESRN
jgi:hypothetical protein